MPGLQAPNKAVKETEHSRFVRIEHIHMRRLRISAISYLNTAPLMWDFEHGTAGADFDISYTVPSACAESLRAGTADIGIIPAAAYTQIPDLSVLPGIAIAARRAVRSILLVCKVPLEKVRSIALDNSSMTSVALTKVLFERWLGAGRTFTSMAPGVDFMLREHDACMVIGDTALQVDRTLYLAFDLAEEWIRFTGKPFVFAFWAVTRSALEESPQAVNLAEIFQQSLEHGLEPENLNQIARDWAPRLELSEGAIRSYLTENIHYSLDPACLEGLRLFYRYAEECGALPVAPALRFLPEAELPKSRVQSPAPLVI
jgi:chorismate dehydratase